MNNQARNHVIMNDAKISVDTFMSRHDVLWLPYKRKRFYIGHRVAELLGLADIYHENSYFAKYYKISKTNCTKLMYYPLNSEICFISSEGIKQIIRYNKSHPTCKKLKEQIDVMSVRMQNKDRHNIRPNLLDFFNEPD